MPNYSNTSLARLLSCTENIQRVFIKVVNRFDCTILEGYRSKVRQNSLYDQGRSQVRYPKGKHNKNPSEAVDAAPYPLDWTTSPDVMKKMQENYGISDSVMFELQSAIDNQCRWHYFAGYVLATGHSMGIELRWGGDWDMDYDIDDNRFDDLPHFEEVSQT